MWLRNACARSVGSHYRLFSMFYAVLWDFVRIFTGMHGPSFENDSESGPQRDPLQIVRLPDRCTQGCIPHSKVIARAQRGERKQTSLAVTLGNHR